MKIFDWNKFKNEKIAVHCKTEEEANNFLKKADKKLISWAEASNNLITRNRWQPYNEDTCYRCSEDNGEYVLWYDGIDFYKIEGYKIVEWSEFMCNFKIGDRVKCIMGDEKYKDVIGKIGTIEDIYNQIYFVQFDGMGDNLWIFAEEKGNLDWLELIDEKLVIEKQGDVVSGKYENKVIECHSDDFLDGAYKVLDKLKKPKFKVGQDIKIIGVDLFDTVNLKWVKENAPEYLGYYTYGCSPTIYELYSDNFYIVAVGTDNKYLIQHRDTKQCYLVSENGLEAI